MEHNIDPAVQAKPWTKKTPPKRILAIRLQAMGDVVITLPYLQHLRETLPPSTQIDFLTRVETDPIPRNLVLFNNIFSIAGKRNHKMQFIFTLLLLPRLIFRRYDMVLDLQMNIISRFVRKVLRPRAWTEFDRFSPRAAGERTRLTIESIGLPSAASSQFILKNGLGVKEILHNNGWDGKKKLVVLNPAGFFVTRNWPVDSYTRFAELWLQKFPDTQFLITGIGHIEKKAAQMKEKLGDHVINIVGKTDAAQAFALLKHVQFMLTEDSGLMHMSWVSGVPTFVLFGGTRSDKTRPVGEHTAFLDSSDLPCGNCMQETCQWGDTRCLTRYTPEMVFEKAIQLIA